MRRIVSAAALVLLVGGATLAAKPAAAQIPPELKNENIDFAYHEPQSEKYRPIYERLKERKILEQLAAFLSPLRLQGALMLSLEEGGPVCRSANSYYSRSTLHLCYSWFYMLENEASVEFKREPNEPFTAATPGLIPGFTRADVIIGGTIGVILHELGHALFDIQDIPLLGREEDAADQINALIMMQFGPKIAQVAIKGEFNVSHHFHAERMRKQRGQIDFRQEADSHGVDIQRAWNVLCIAYGKDPQTFAQLAEQLLPRARRQYCADEYKQVAFAFRKTILPDIDPAMMEQVLKMEILKPEDFRF